MESDKLTKAIEAAKMYYLFDYNQNEIAKKLGVSRPTVSRLLQQAKSEGIVQIKIIDSTIDVKELSAQLEQTFKLKKAIVASIPHEDRNLVKEGLGEAAADYLDKIVKDEDIIGVTWGTTLYHVGMKLKNKRVKDVKVVQLKGGVSHSETNTYASEILHLFGNAYSTVPLYLPLPAIVDHVVVKQAMEADRHIKGILELGKKANIAIFTTGPIKTDSLLFQLGYFTEEDLKQLDPHAVGDICSRFFDENGCICNPSLNERTLGLDLEELKQKEHSILVAGGAHKVKGIYGAIKGGYVNTLVTDPFTAQQLLEKVTS
ncbi:RNA polymerase subunit sigma-70 [Bacillus sp. VT 712]|uniref:sugar-binding transcriptional regulator n=1 Tax=Bacillaceae TaxID=186817 RepID=UPI000473DCE6|nr:MULTISPECIES: sugar-binding transcriptional regulator [Bacillaceae]KZB93484.1 RNA polymerase subunit sigma-70 [Bacillus sp. VT 712]